MKTINNTFAFLLAGFAFTACTQQTIEPGKPIYQAQSTMRADSTRPYRDTSENAVELVKLQHGVVVVSPVNEPTPKPATDQPPVATLSPRPMPRLTVMPLIQENTLAQ